MIPNVIPTTRVCIVPIVPLEGRAEIFPSPATGPFAWRIASFVQDDQRRQLKLWGPIALNRAMSADPPSLVLLVRERDLDLPLIGYGLEHSTPILCLFPKPRWYARSSEKRMACQPVATGPDEHPASSEHDAAMIGASD